jgi:DNA-binding transcriptional ArsR family regulator
MAVRALTHVGALLADSTRASLLTVLMDGRARTGGELARQVGVAPSTASEHLSRLLDAQSIAVEAQGRHRYFRLAGSEIAELLESLGAVVVPGRARDSSEAKAPSELLQARSCYDHLAGRLAVRIYDQLLANEHLHRAHNHLTLTPSGQALLADLGVDMQTVRNASRPIARSCPDWTERRHHLAGAAGAALFDILLARRWIMRGSRPRSIRITDAGQRGLQQALNT